MILYKAELERRIEAGKLIVNPRRKDRTIDLQPSSYDLMAGRAVWKEMQGNRSSIQERAYDPAIPFDRQPTVQLEPGQMMWVITHEELDIPVECCATVFSKNHLAMSGIFAFNAGHVDPGYRGPIVIRLISLRATPYTITLGEPIFTVVFETLDVPEIDLPHLAGRPPLTMEEALTKVRRFADVALSNALFDLYAAKIEERLSNYKRDTLIQLREEIDKDFVKEEKLNYKLWTWFWRAVLVVLGIVASVLAISANWAKLKGLFH